MYRMIFPILGHPEMEMNIHQNRRGERLLYSKGTDDLGMGPSFTLRPGLFIGVFELVLAMQKPQGLAWDTEEFILGQL